MRVSSSITKLYLGGSGKREKADTIKHRFFSPSGLGVRSYGQPVYIDHIYILFVQLHINVHISVRLHPWEDCQALASHFSLNAFC